MAFRMSKHLLSLINWNKVTTDPIRKQFLPFEKEYEPDHKYATHDSLLELKNMEKSRIIHRYPN